MTSLTLHGPRTPPWLWSSWQIWSIVTLRVLAHARDILLQGPPRRGARLCLRAAAPAHISETEELVALATKDTLFATLTDYGLPPGANAAPPTLGPA
ncbi:hypothetical protein AURDEDRAFT_164189 [Auricularia subglabra TFB-10046 SS5]|nr:hypothetical protein AURDEDRAFT_164189 [Auricularia subglabra TFB-10046 SS5]